MGRLLARWPFTDHLWRAWQRYQADTGDRLAAAVTFYWFLSLFPILLLAIYVLGLVNGDTAEADVEGALSGYLPRELVATIGKVIGDNAGTAGLIGVGGLLLSGLGWIDGLRDAIRTIWHQNVKAGNIVTRKLVDAVALVGLLATIGVSVFVTSLVGSGPSWVLDHLGADPDSVLAKVVLKVAGMLLAGLADLALFLYLFLRLARVPSPLRQVVRGAVFGAVGFGVLKLVGGFYVQHTTTKGEATYGTFAVVVGLLLFLNLLSRLVLLAAAFTVTAPGDDDVRPSGTADPEQARRAGMPEELAGSDLNLVEDGAPTPLRAAVQGSMDDVERSWSAKQPVEVAEEQQPSAVPAEPAGADQVRLAARVLQGIAAAVVALVGVHAARTVLGVLRR